MVSHSEENENFISIRNQYLRMEALVKSFGILYYSITFCFTLIWLIGVFAQPLKSTNSIFLVCAIVCLAVGYGLYKLKRISYVLAIITSLTLIYIIPYSLIVLGFLIFHFLRKKVSYIFSKQYSYVISSTPQIKSRSYRILNLIFSIIMTPFMYGIIQGFTVKN